MIRKVIIVMLTLATIGTGLPALVSCVGRPLLWESSAGDSRAGFSQGAFYVELRRVLDPRQAERLTEWSWSTQGVADFLIGNHEFYYGTGVVNWHDGTSLRHTLVRCSVAPLVLLLAVYPTISLIRGPLRRRRRRGKGLCLKCGYDLTGNVSGVCSECGQVIQKDCANTGQP